jgi:hypothetical protein
MKYIVKTTQTVKGREWSFYLLSDRVFDKLHNADGEENAAMTLPPKYEVHFSKSSWSMIDIRHELGHVFFIMTGTNSSNLDVAQVEETMCSIIGADLQEIALIGDRIAECFFNA